METPYHKMELKFAGVDMLHDQQLYGSSWGNVPVPPTAVATDHRRQVGMESDSSRGQEREREEEALSKTLSAMTTLTHRQTVINAPSSVSEKRKQEVSKKGRKAEEGAVGAPPSAHPRPHHP